MAQSAHCALGFLLLIRKYRNMIEIPRHRALIPKKRRAHPQVPSENAGFEMISAVGKLGCVTWDVANFSAQASEPRAARSQNTKPMRCSLGRDEDYRSSVIIRYHKLFVNYFKT